MNKPQQATYHSIFVGVKNLSDEIQVPALSGEELYNIFFQMRLDHPEIFWVTNFKYRYYKDSPNLIFIPEYLFEKNKIREHQKALTARVEKLVRPAQKMSEWEKEKYVHDFICENVRYDKLKKAYSHEIIGPLGQSVGVCEGIAKAVKVLLDALGVWCVIAICGNNPEKGIKYRHTWNIVKINGTYYHLDATFDNSLGKDHENTEIRYDYFNLDDQQIFRDHEPLIAPAPHCNDHDHFYYKEKKLSFTKQEDVYKRSLQAAKKGKVLVFHWRGGYLTKEVLNELLDLIRKAGMEKEKNAMVSINWPQAVPVSYTHLKACDSSEMFSNLEISNSPDFVEHLNKYDVIHFDVQWCMMAAGGPENIVSYITEQTILELREFYPDEFPEDVNSLPEALSQINNATGNKFVVIIDEWDVLIRDEAQNQQIQDGYIDFLRGMFKGTEPTRFIALAFLTGILPIKKLKTQSALNTFCLLYTSSLLPATI